MVCVSPVFADVVVVVVVVDVVVVCGFSPRLLLVMLRVTLCACHFFNFIFTSALPSASIVCRLTQITCSTGDMYD